MSLKLICGASGSGKSEYLFGEIIERAAKDRDKNHIVLVPDQFSQEAQRILVEKNSGAILNIDVLSFNRLYYYALTEARADAATMLTDEGKVMLLRKELSDNKANLKYFTKGLDRPGFLDELKSLLSECILYELDEEKFDELSEKSGKDSALGLKLNDIKLLYLGMKEKMGSKYMAAEEMIPRLTRLVPSLSFLKNTTISLDGFTGFIPSQYELIKELLKVCDDVYVTVTTDRDRVLLNKKRADVFEISQKTIKKLYEVANEAGVEAKEPVITGYGDKKGSYRLKNNAVLDHLEQNIFDREAKIYNEDDMTSDEGVIIQEEDAIDIRVCASIKKEAEYAAREIARLVRNGEKYSDIAVILGDTNAYETYVISAFEKLHIRYFSDHKKSLGTNPLTEYISSFLDMCTGGFDVEYCVRFLRCRLSVLEQEETDIFENYIIGSGRRGLEAFEEPWTYDVDEYRLPLEKINSYRERFYSSVSETAKNLRGKEKTVAEYTRIIYDFLVKEKAYEKLLEISEKFESENKILLAKEYKKLYGAVMKILDNLVSLIGDETMNLKEYSRVLKAGMSEGVMGFVPPSDDAVLVGDLMRSRLSEIRHLFILGNNDYIFPKSVSEKGILTTRERKTIEELGTVLAPTTEEQYNREQFYFYMLLTKPTVALHLSYSKTNSDSDPVAESYIIKRITSIFKNVSIKNDDADESYETLIGTDFGKKTLLRSVALRKNDETVRGIARYYSEKDPSFFKKIQMVSDINKINASIPDQTARDLYGDLMFASVSRIEKFASCPYAHFLDYGLRLSERIKYDPNAADRGTVFHKCLEKFTTELNTRKLKWQDLDDKTIEEIADKTMEETVSGFKDDLFFKDKRTSYMIKKMKKVYRDSLKHLRHQMLAGSFEQKYSEVSFPDANSEDEMTEEIKKGIKIRLHGRIDRIDMYNDKFVKIIDYKSSSRKLVLGEVYYGLSLQLMTYLRAAMKMAGEGSVPAAVLYFAVDESEKDWTETIEELKAAGKVDTAGFRPDGYINSDPDIVKLLDDNLSTAEPKSEVIPATMTKSGTLHASRSNAITTEEFELLMNHTVNRIKQNGKKIYEGTIHAKPTAYGSGEPACKYCEYAGVCGIDSRSKETAIQHLKSMKPNEVLEELENE